MAMAAGIHETDDMRKGELRRSIVTVEDDPLYGRMLNHQLGTIGYECQLITSGTQFLDYLPAAKPLPDLFIFDYFLGHDEPTGLSLCRRVRSLCNVPVIILTGNNKLETLVSCLKAGADHYIVKPCDIRELEARIISSLRKPLHAVPGQLHSIDLGLDGGLTLKCQEQLLVSGDGAQVLLTEKECGLLELFVSAADGYLDRENAFQVLYGYAMPPANRSIDVLVSKVRKKLTDLDPSYRIKPLRARGYSMFRSNETAAP